MFRVSTRVRWRKGQYRWWQWRSGLRKVRVNWMWKSPKCEFGNARFWREASWRVGWVRRRVWEEGKNVEAMLKVEKFQTWQVRGKVKRKLLTFIKKWRIKTSSFTNKIWYFKKWQLKTSYFIYKMWQSYNYRIIL